MPRTDEPQQQAPPATSPQADAGFRAFTDSCPDAIFIRRGQLMLHANPALCDLLGYRLDELLGRDPVELFVHPQDRVEVLEHRRDRPDGAELRPSRWLRKSGGIVHIEAVGITVMFEGGPARVVMCRNQTRRMEQQASLMATDRLASVATLAAGVAHEINNPLSFVVANLEVIADELSACAAPPVVQEALSDALEGARRIGAIVGRLRPLSRGEIDQRRQIDPRTVLDAALELAAHQLEGRARVERFYQEVPRVEADVGRLVQVVVNLLGNAADAFVEPGAAGNLIRVEALEAPGGKVALVVRDTGVGIAPEKLDRVFDPFFTTKPVGQGTGLGLTISRTLVRGLGGELSVESEPGRGSAFTVLLPAVQ